MKKKRLAQWLRMRADRLDPDGAPRLTSWGITFEDGFGTVFNQDGRGCPLWLHARDYHRAHDEAGRYGEPHDIEWVTIGMRTETGVHVLGSAEVKNGSTTRRAETHGRVDIPVPTTRVGPPNVRTARIPNWVITLKCEMHSFVTQPGATYPDAVTRMFGRSGIKG